MRWTISIIIGTIAGVIGHTLFPMPSESSVLSTILHHSQNLAAVPKLIRIAAQVIVHPPGAYHRIEHLWIALCAGVPWAIAFMAMSGKKKEVVQVGKLPEYVQPEKRDDLYVVLGEVHDRITGKPSRKPQWLTVPEKGLYAGVALIGQTGRGKTSSGIEPIIEQLVNFKRDDAGQKLSGLLLDFKGDLADVMVRKAAEARRSDDVRIVGLQPYSPMGNDLLPSSELADALAAVMAETKTGGGHLEAPFFRNAATGLAFDAIELIRLTDGWPTLSKVYRLIGDPDAMQQRLIEADIKINGDLYYTFTRAQRRNKEPKKGEPNGKIGRTTHADGTETIGEFDGEFHQDDQKWWVPYSRALFDFCHPEFGIPGRRRSKPDVEHGVEQHGGSGNEDLKQRLSTVRFDINKWWSVIGKERMADAGLGMANILKMFEAPRLFDMLCPPQDHPELIAPMHELIDSGKLVVVKFTHADERVSKLVASILKLDYYRSVMMRFERKGPYRRTFFVCDEYDALAGEADAWFAERCRAAKCIRILSYPGLQGLKMALGDRWGAAFSTASTRLFLEAGDQLTAREASEWCGKHKVWRSQPSMSQQKSGTNRGSLSLSRHISEEPIFAPDRFTHIEVGQAIGRVFDGRKTHPATRVHLKSASIPAAERYAHSVFEQEVA